MSTHPRKLCKDCGQLLTLRHFYAHASYADGRMNSCRACKITAVTENRDLKLEHYREYKRQWSARPENVAKRKAYRQTERGREVHREACRVYVRFKQLEQRA